jgi:AhpD family alkylhydroperoxidase
MQTRINFFKTTPAAYNALMELSKFIATTPLSPVHQELIKIRASQINGCAFCINMHTAEARKQGISEQRIYLLSAWREADVYTEEEQAILAFIEEVTLISHHVSDATYANLARFFDEQYISAILMMAIIINSWNRMAIATGLRVA